MNSDIWTPSYKTGYARNAAESANPDLWKGLLGAWVPALGVTGGNLPNLVNHKADLDDFVNMDLATDWVSSPIGPVVDFDGVNDYVRSTTPLPLPSFPMTLSHWVYPISGIHFRTVFRTHYASTNSAGSWILTRDDNTIGVGFGRQFTGFEDPTMSNVANTTATIPLNTWSHIAGVIRGNGDIKVYINGQQVSVTYVGTAVITGTNPIYPAQLGMTYKFAGLRYARMRSSTLLYYNDTRTPAEIQHLYEDPLAPFRLASSFVPYIIGTSVTYEYELESSLDNVAFTPLAIVPAGDQLYNHIGLDHGTQYFYRLRTNEVGTPENSSPWVYADATTVPIVYEYEIESSLDGVTYAPLAIVPAGDQLYDHIGLDPNTRYYYRIRSRDVAIPTDISSWAYADAKTASDVTFQRLAGFQTKTPGIRIFN